MAQNFEWFEPLRVQHSTLPGGILYNGLEQSTLGAPPWSEGDRLLVTPPP
jgi:hypothetical protein